MATNYHQGEASQIHEEHQHNAQARRVVEVPKAEQTLIDQVNGNLIYIGHALLGNATSDAVWQILRIQTVGSVTSIQQADGSLDYTKVWDDRASLSYS